MALQPVARTVIFQHQRIAVVHYVAISRARHGAAVYTDNRASLTDALGLRDGAQVGAIDETMKAPDVATITAPAPVKAVEMAIGG